MSRLIQSKLPSIFLIGISVCLLFLTATHKVLAETDIEETIAVMEINSDKIAWKPLIDNAGFFLTVSGPGSSYYEKLFKAGNLPVFELRDNFDVPFPDGSCKYELNALPAVSEDLEKVMKDYRKWEAAGYQTTFKENTLLRYNTQQSGGFLIENGRIVSDDIPLNRTLTDQDPSGKAYDVVINDDHIITGSSCVGFDCVNGESFGFDTLKLKENNLRILFDDTSTSGSFPSNDWRLQANDSSNGGASYFSIWDATANRKVFAVEAGAPSNALYVEDYGRIGFGTSTPYVELHMKDGDTPTVRLDQDGSSGWAPQSWDIAGNESNFFIRDVTNGSKLSFRIQPNTPSDTLTLKSTGYVGIGTWSPEYPLEVETTGQDSRIIAQRTDGSNGGMQARVSVFSIGSFTDTPVRLFTNNSWRMQLNSDNSLDMRNNATCTAGGVWTSVSSRESKTNIRDLSTDEAIETLNGLNPVKFFYKAESDEEYLGFIAEEVPELVSTKDRKHMVEMDIVAVLTKVAQEQQLLIQNQQEAIEELKERLDRLERK